jgi:signal peptidase I
MFSKKPKKEKEPKTAAGSLIELVTIVVVAVGLALLIQAVLVKPYRIPSESMVPTLEIGQRVLVNRLGERFSNPSVGDVVVFHPPAGAERNEQCGAEPAQGAPCTKPTKDRADVNFIKRVVAGPGDRLRIDNGRVVLNGRPVKEPYARPCGGGGECDYPKEITVPAGHYFMMGDNRGASQDSRFWGPVPEKWVIGGAFATYWPPGRVGLL